MPKSQTTSDIVVIGTGAAGLSCALHLAEYAPVTLVTKGALSEGASRWAQGGIAAVLSPDDSFSAHQQDTQTAGSYLCHEDIVKMTIEQSPHCIAWLRRLGVPFTEENGHLHLTREGGHQARRVAHVADATGKAVSEVLTTHVLSNPNIRCLTDTAVIDLCCDSGRVHGLRLLDTKKGTSFQLSAQAVVLATGGASRAYLYSTNPDIASGDGIAMAWRAGCRVANLEFNQFHPTCLYHPKAYGLLLTEAIRGEGGILKRADGKRFMPDHHPLAELAPRDVVARAIDFELKKTSDPCVYLDISHESSQMIEKRFPNLLAACLHYGLDLRVDPIPVVPAAHYTCGGVLTGKHGETDIKGLYAIGETAFTGLHGANRLASNSLLECFVFAKNAADHILSHMTDRIKIVPPLLKVNSGVAADSSQIAEYTHALRDTMWRLMGIVRTDDRLHLAEKEISALQQKVDRLYQDAQPCRALIELRNLTTCGLLMVKSALLRKESRGLHFNVDHPKALPTIADTILIPQTFVKNTTLTTPEKKREKA